MKALVPDFSLRIDDAIPVEQMRYLVLHASVWQRSHRQLASLKMNWPSLFQPRAVCSGFNSSSCIYRLASPQVVPSGIQPSIVGDDVGVLASKLGVAVGAMVTACVGTAVGADVIVGSTTHRPNSRVTVEMISVA